MSAMVVAPQPIAVEEGAQVLAEGGNAIDAAVTTALVQWIVDPHCCSAGGYLVMNAHLNTTEAGIENPVVVDAPAVAGSKVSADMWLDRVLRPNPDGWGFFLKGKVNELGYRSLCTPGAVMGLTSILERWGTISLERAAAPAIRAAREGFIVSAELAGQWKFPAPYPEASSALESLRANKEAGRIYLHPDGSPFEAGQALRNSDYARTLERLVQAGGDDFYQGEIAREMTRDFEAQDALVTADDLASYRLRDARPVWGEYRGLKISSSPAPHGGPTLIAILNILDQYDLDALQHNSADYVYLVSMAMKAAFADRNQWLADPLFVDVPLQEMICEQRAAHWKGAIDRGEPIVVLRGEKGPSDTTQVTVIDGGGNCVSLTHSRGSLTGGVVTPGLGFMYNNSMINFDPRPGKPNSIAPRKGRTTGMTPTIVYDQQQPRLVLGAPGATRIITAVLQVILNVVDFDMSISDAVLAPRFDCQGDVIYCQARIPKSVCADVRRRHRIQRLPQSHGGMALVHAVHIHPATGRVTGAADAGGGGMALLV